MSATSSVANEVVSNVRQKKPITVKRIITNEYFLYVVSLCSFFIVWHNAANSAMLGKGLATPFEVGEKLVYMTQMKLAGKGLFGHIWASTYRVLYGFILASVFAIPLGLFMALNRYVNAIVKPIFDIFKPMPPIAWISIAILWFGIGEPSKIFIIFIGTFVPCLLNAYNGVRLIEPELYDVVRSLGGGRRDEIIQVCFPASFPAIFAGLQISLSSAWTCVIAAELVSARAGMGWIIIQGMKLSEPALVIGGMLIIAAIALTTSLALTALEKWLCPWKREIADY